MKKTFELNIEQLNRAPLKTPFYLYDEEKIRQRARLLNQAFKWNKGFVEHFATKATPTPAILKILREENCGLDCASKSELQLADLCGFKEEEIIFTSNQTQDDDYLEALKNKVLINLDSYDQINNLLKVCKINNYSFPSTLCFRYNPGHFEIDASYIGELSASKFGMKEEDLLKAIKETTKLGTKHFGIHGMLAGNSLKEEYYPLLAKLLFSLTKKIKQELNIDIEFIDLAGGLGIPYREQEEEIDILAIGQRVKNIYDEYQMNVSLKCESGRFVLGPCGYLVSRVVGIKESYRKYVGIDASMADLMRPGMYDAYHHMEILNNNPEKEIVDVVGPICENNDKFCQNRLLNKANLGDYLVIYDAGAHGRSMGFNYNGRLRCGEILFTKEKTFKLIRRPESFEDYIATCIF